MMASNNNNNMEELQAIPEVAVNVDGAVDDAEDHRVHDQLPQSAEDLKHDLRLNETNRSCIRCRRWWKPLLGVLVVVLIVVAVVLGFAVSRGNKNNNSSGNSNLIDAPTLATTPPAATPSVTTTNALEAVETLLRSEIALQGGEEFNNPRSYQSRAKDALLDDPLATERSEQKLAQRYALLCLYYATNRKQTDVTDKAFGVGTVPQWRDFQHWKYHDLHECEWHGIACNQFGFVTEIDLSQNGLTGQIPEEITLLWRRLEKLSVDSNLGLGQGGIPWFLSEFGELTSLNLRGCSYSGEMPASLCGLVQARRILDITADCDRGDGDLSPVTCSCCANC